MAGGVGGTKTTTTQQLNTWRELRMEKGEKLRGDEKGGQVRWAKKVCLSVRWGKIETFGNKNPVCGGGGGEERKQRVICGMEEKRLFL